MATVKSLIKQYSELKQRIRIWDEVKSFLERTYGPDPLHPISMEDGSLVDGEVILNVMSELDDIVADTIRQINDMEKMEVNGGKGVTRKKARPASGSKRKGRKGTGGAGSPSGEDNKSSGEPG